jgi:hypothetical protein
MSVLEIVRPKVRGATRTRSTDCPSPSIRRDGGKKLARVADLMGHSSPVVTLKVYAHWLRDDETSGVAELARALCAEDATLPLPPDSATESSRGAVVTEWSQRKENGADRRAK